MELDFSRCRDVWVPDDTEAGGFWSPPPPHVKVGVEWICRLPYMLLADDMGGMKTAQAIIAAQFLHDADIIDRAIVVAPASVRSKVWFDQDLGQLREQVFGDKRNHVSEYHAKIKSWSHGPTTTVKCSKCSTPTRDKEQEHPGICICGGYLNDIATKELRWIVTNYEFIRNRANLDVLLPYCGPKTLLILDESSAVKGYDSAQTDACMILRWMTNKKGRPVLGVPRCGRILELNGTPVADSPLDMFSQGNLLHPSILECKYITHYKGRYAIQEPVLERGEPMKRYGKVVQSVAGWSKEGIEDLQRRFAPYVLRREAKDLGIDFALPPVGLEVRLTEQTWRHYRAMRDEMVVWLTSGVATARQAGVKSVRLAQITSGFLGGVEDDGLDDLEQAALWGLDPITGEVRTVTTEVKEDGTRTSRLAVNAVQEIGREKLDFALAWQAELLARYQDLKLLTWCRFVPELRRYLAEVARLGHPVGALCGQKVLAGDHTQKDERAFAERLFHPKTAPAGPATLGATQGTGALGGNMTACRTVLDMSYDFSPWKKKQGDARVNRTGQRGPVSFFYLVAVGPKGQKTMDHHVMMQRLGKTNINDWTTSAWVRALEEE